MKTSQSYISVKTNVFLLLISFLFLLSCEDDGPIIESINENEIIEKETLENETLELGGNYQGGIIFYIDETGQHGLIAAKEDQSITDPWRNQELLITGAVSLSNGKDNTKLIIDAQGNTGLYAAKICSDYESGGYNDWFLPSKDQLNILYQNKHLMEGFVEQLYWSSTEYEIGIAWVQDFTSGEQHLDNTSDSANVHTRAIREF